MSMVKLTRKNMMFLVAIALLVVFLVSLPLLSVLFIPQTVLSVSSISIDPQGYEDATTGEWRGSFWSIVMTTDCTDQVATYKFDKVESEKGTDTIGDKKLVPTSTIIIKIDPQQPYWERPIEIKSVTVVPATDGLWQGKIAGWGRWTDVGVDAVYSGHYEWGTGYWEAHTPFKVTVLKNGVEIGTKTIDTLGKTQTVRIPDSGEEHITIADLGKLGTGYGEPQLGDIMLFSMDEIFKLDAESKGLVKYDAGVTPHEDAYNWGFDHWTVHPTESYSTYWYGWGRWKSDDSPSAYEFGHLIDDSKYGGWLPDDDTWNWRKKPVAPVIFPADKSQLPTEKQKFKSLIEYLSSKGVPEIDPWVWKDSKKPEIITDSATGSKKLRVYLPFGSMNSLITLKISTELADTIVWQPQVANIKITSMPDLGDIGDRKTSTIELKQESTVASSGTISLTVEPTTAPLSINPPAFGTGTMNPGDTKTFTYEILNLGGDVKVPFTITATITNSLGAITDTDTAAGTLLPKGAGETTLTVYTMDDETKEKVSGIAITVTYDSESKSGVTSDGSISWNLGSAQPSVTVTSAETPTYKSKTVTQQMVAGPNTVYLYLVGQGVQEKEMPWWQEYLWLIIAGVVITVIVVSVVYANRAKLRKGVKKL